MYTVPANKKVAGSLQYSRGSSGTCVMRIIFTNYGHKTPGDVRDVLETLHVYIPEAVREHV